MRPDRFFRRQVSLGFAAAFFTILGAKWALIDAFGSDLPYWDQWYAEGYLLYVPYLGKSLSWPVLFASGNEHRMVFSRVLSLGLLALNGQWDARLQMMVNAALHSCVSVGLGLMLWRVCGKRFLTPILALVVATAALPFAYENALWGFQSCFYFLIGFAILSIWLLSESRPLSAGWLSGGLASVCGLFTMGSGFLVPVAVLTVLGIGYRRKRGEWKDAVGTAAICLAVAAAGVALLSGAGGDATLRAATVSEFFGALGRALAWPYVTLPWVAILAWLPLSILLVRFLRSRESGDEGLRGVRVLLALGVWVGLQAAAMAYSRGAGAARPASRYMDILSLGVVVNGIALGVLVSDPVHGRFRTLGRLVASVWLPWLVVGLGIASAYVVRYSLPKFRADHLTQLANVRAFVQTDSMSYFTGGALRSIPNSSPDALAFYLRNSAIRSILPVSVREPLRVTAAGGDGAFALDGVAPATPIVPSERAWGSYVGEGVRTRGTFKSRPLSGGALPYLHFEVAGVAGPGAVSLDLRTPDGGRRPVSLERLAVERWRAVTVARPAGAVIVEARDDRERSWFAFREPREVGRLSFWSGALAPRAVWLLAGGMALLLFVLGTVGHARWRVVGGRDNPEPPGSQHA